MALLSRGEKLLSSLKFSGRFCGADRYSKQQLHVWSQHRVRTLVLRDDKCYRKEPKMGSENSEFQAMVCASGREITGIYQ
jgi:hypothetical protein